ncbi:MAG: hypothetical protein M3N54_14320 [Acidobacteriota bacterium]|nr:hypothetical protein [Acidobacteriota bacterium]
MKRLCLVAAAVAFVADPAYPQQPPDAKTLMVRSIETYDRDWRAGMKWGYTQTDITTVDGKKVVELSEVVPLEGTPYERLISRDGHPLSPEEQRKEDAKYEKAMKQRQSESPSERQARIRKYEDERSFLKDLPNAYDFKLLGEETVDGRPAWILSLTPLPDFVPTTPHGAMLKHITGKLWIDKQSLQWAKAEAHVIDTISIGWILARIGAGAEISLQMTRVTDQLWMPKQICINGSARVLMVHNKNLNEELTFSGYHADSALSSRK